MCQMDAQESAGTRSSFKSLARGSKRHNCHMFINCYASNRHCIYVTGMWREVFMACLHAVEMASICHLSSFNFEYPIFF